MLTATVLTWRDKNPPSVLSGAGGPIGTRFPHRTNVYTLVTGDHEASIAQPPQPKLEEPAVGEYVPTIHSTVHTTVHTASQASLDAPCSHPSEPDAPLASHPLPGTPTSVSADTRHILPPAPDAPLATTSAHTAHSTRSALKAEQSATQIDLTLKLATSATSSVPPPAIPKRSKVSLRGLRAITRKLLTKEDWLHMHAWTNALLFAICVPRTLQCCYEMFVNSSAVTPLPFEFPIVVSLAILRDITSVPLAYKFRRGNPRMMFLLSAYINLCAWSVAAYFMPSYSMIPRLPDSITAAGILLLVLPLVATIVYSVLDPGENFKAVVENSSAVERKAAQNESAAKQAALSALYVATMIVPCVIELQFIIPVLWGGSAVFDYMIGHYPHLEQLTYSATMVGATTADLAIFSNTLKDRRVISRKGMDMFQLGSMVILTVFVLKMAITHPDGGILFSPLTNLRFWAPPWAA